MNLTREQVKHLPSIEWLVADTRPDRYSGRTTVLLYALILKAINNPNVYVPIIDHYPLSKLHFEVNVGRLLKIMLQDIEFKDKNIILNETDMAIKYKP